jgi:hypothetical protein
MSDSPNQITRADVEEAILARVMEDPAFAAHLKADPKAALCGMFDTEIPADLQISVFEETPNHLMIRIPVMFTDEISESELEGVAGGACTPLAKIKIPTIVKKGALNMGASAAGSGVTWGIERAVHETRRAARY